MSNDRNPVAQLKAEIVVGSRVRVVKDIGRIDTIVAITVNVFGTRLFWLSRGGCFNEREIERY